MVDVEDEALSSPPITPLPPIAGEIVIDVSHWEGIIDWQRVPARKVIIKLTDGINLGDPLAGYNARCAREEGKRVGFYHYLRPSLDVEMQMDVFGCALYGVWHDDAEPIALDIETTSGLLQYRMKAYVIAAYKHLLLDTQVVPEIYSRASFWRPCVGVIDWAALRLPEPPAWMADYGYYGRGEGITGPRWLASTGWKVYRRWQYTDKGIVPGIRSACDLNVEPPHA